MGELVAQNPALSRVFEDLQIDYCCGGRRRLADVCSERQLSVADMIGRLREFRGSEAESPSRTDWMASSLTDLCDHIERTHHAFLRDALPRLAELLTKVVSAHGQRHPELVQIQHVFESLRAELETHMLKEERILFPAVRELEQANRPTKFHFGSIADPIRVMEHEHDSAGDALIRIRQLTSNFQPPIYACLTFRALYERLERLEQDLHQHVHKENNILFPRALAIKPATCG